MVLKQCPVQGCGKWSNRWKHRGYPLPNDGSFTLLLDQRLSAPTNSHICKACWDRHVDHSVPLAGRTRAPAAAADGLLALLDAADQSQSEPPPPVSLPPPPLTTSSTLAPPTTTSTIYAAVPSVHPQILSPPPLALSDLTNAPIDVAPPGSRRSLSLKRKREMLRAVDKAATEEERKEVMQQQGLSGRDVKRFRAQVESNASAPKGMRSPLTAKHRKGGGRKATLSSQQELELREWVMSLRRSESRFRVTERMIQLKAREQFGIKAGNKWVQGFMVRHRFSLRRKTTTKEVTTTRMQEIRRHYQNKHAELFATVSWFNFLNMDETSVYRDAPGDRTVDEVGAKTVEIGSTQHDADRVAVVLCIDRAGSMIPPLIIHKCYEKKRFKKRHAFFLKSIPLDGGQQYNVWVTYANKSWLNGIIMRQWIDKVYMGHIRSRGIDVSQALLFMDNCSAHDNESAMQAMAEAKVRCEFFPPNCTPILQPLDQNVNKMLKEEYEKRWEKWFIEVGSRQLTRGGNRKRATDDEVNGWVASSLHAISAHVVRMLLEEDDGRSASRHEAAAEAVGHHLVLPLWRGRRTAWRATSAVPRCSPPALRWQSLPVPSKAEEDESE